MPSNWLEEAVACFPRGVCSSQGMCSLFKTRIRHDTSRDGLTGDATNSRFHQWALQLAAAVTGTRT